VLEPVKPEIRDKVILLHLSGLGRNQIDRELRQQGVKVSHGSISNIITRHLREKQSQKSITDNGSLITMDNQDKTSPPLPIQVLGWLIVIIIKI
jgi:hypothetical protein